MLALLGIGAAALGVIVWEAATRTPGVDLEVGARESWEATKRRAELHATKRARTDARVRLAGAERFGDADVDELRRRVRDADQVQARSAAAAVRRSAARARVSCCDASDDDWRGARDVYGRWVPPQPMGFREAKRAVLEESRQYAEAGDYSKPASRRAVLGRMHENKLAQWSQCRSECAGDGWWVWAVEDGRTAVSRRGAETLYLRPLTLGWWAVERLNGQQWRELDRFEDYEQALGDAKERLTDDSPF